MAHAPRGMPEDASMKSYVSLATKSPRRAGGAERAS